jgi:tetratricopeptide (TPR) repeat protein
MAMNALRHRMVRLSRVGVALLLSFWLTACGGPSAAEYVERGDAFVAQDKLAEASIEYRNALQADPNLGEVRLKLADLHLRLNDPAQALREYVRAADLLPDNLDAQLKAGNLLLRAGQFEDAKARATKAVALDGTNAQAQILLGNTLAGLRDVEGAIAEYQQALVLNPSEEVAYRNIATLQMSSGQIAEAEVSFRKAIDVAPQSVEPRMALGNFLWANNRVSEAEQVFKDALALDPKNLYAARALGTFYVGANRIPEAEPYFTAIAEAEKTPAASIALADYYIVAKRLDDARTLLKQTANDKDAYPAAMLRLAAIDVALGVRAQAQEKLGELLERHPKEMAARLLNARLLVLDGKREEALVQAASIARDDAQSPVAADAQILTGSLQAALDRPEEAMKSFEDALRRRPRTMTAELALARLHLARGAFDRAEAYVRDALTIDPKNASARAEMVRVLLAQGKTVEARQQLATLRAEYPNAVPVLHLVAVQQVAEKQLPAARATYTRLLQAQPSDVDAMAGLVRIDLATGRRQDALARVTEALSSVSPTGALYILAAQTYSVVGDAAKAEESLLKAIEIEPARLQAYSMLGLMYARQNRLPEAAAHFQQVITRNPSSVSAGTMLGMLHEARGQLGDAEKEYRRVLSLDPQSPIAANNLAWIYIASNRNVREATELAKTALRSLPDEPNVNDTLGWIYYKQGQFSLAVQHLEAAAAKAPDAAQTHYHLGMAYLGYGERDRARDSLARALSFKTEFDGIAEARQKLAELGG